MDRSKSYRWTLALGVAVLIGATATLWPALWADMIVTDSDAQFEGDVISDDDGMVILHTSRGIMYFSRDRIKAAFYSDFPNSSAKIEEIIGTAEYHRKQWDDMERWNELTVGTKLRPGDTMRTGDASKVIATVAGQGVLAVEANSTMTIGEVRRNSAGEVRVRLALESGQLWNDVGTLPSARSRYTVETPQASCGVRGTVYTVLASAETDETTIATIEGSVQVVQKREGGDEVRVGANQQASLAVTGTAETADIEAEYTSQWDGYSGQFQRLRAEMELENRLGPLLARFGITLQQGYLIAGGGIGLIVIVLGVVIIRRVRR